ncbi:MAG: GIY-YIG nuclease family protein [Bacteroidota bacterium]
MHEYYTYITTNFSKTTLYTGVTNNIIRRLEEHQEVAVNGGKSFVGRYKCFWLVYWEEFQYIDNAIAREKEIKGWSRAKKEQLIATINPEWKFLNEDVGCTIA